MENLGWIKLHRKLLENPWFRKPAYRSVWIELLMRAEHKPRDIVWEGKRMTLQPGQLTCGAEQLSRWTMIPRGTIERILKCFKNEEQIEELTSFRFRLITIKNWGSYQKNEEQNEEQVRSKRGASEEQVDTLKEVKNTRIQEMKKKKETGETHFVRPSLEDVQEHCIGTGVDAETFWNFYESNGWKVGRQAMKSWKAAVVTWRKRILTPTPQSSGAPPRPRKFFTEVNGVRKEVSQEEFNRK